MPGTYLPVRAAAWMSMQLVATLVQATTSIVMDPSRTPVLLIANGSGNTELCTGTEKAAKKDV